MSGDLESVPTHPRPVRLAAVGDLHYGRLTANSVVALFAGLDRVADILVLTGDLTDRGLPDEARGLVRELAQSVKLPVVAVLGNHDYEAGKVEEVSAILQEGHVHLLDGDVVELLDVGFAGVKGFCGGFGAHALGAWGEPAVKQFVHEAVAETLKLEAALARLRMPRRVAVLHYAPIQATVEGEPPGDLPVSRFEPSRGAADALPRLAHRPRARPQRAAGRHDVQRHAGVQRRPSADAPDLPPAPVSALRITRRGPLSGERPLVTPGARRDVSRRLKQRVFRLETLWRNACLEDGLVWHPPCKAICRLHNLAALAA